MKRPPIVMFAASALALSVGWGIRGNFGHETGAMVPGALAAMAAVLLSGREDWQDRIAWFAFFGALGWSFGGSISYMQVIGYTHSGHSGSVLYGYACLFVIGFLWAIFGCAGTALPAVLDRDRLHSLFPPIVFVFAAWLLQDLLVASLIQSDPQFRHRDPLYWYDTDWLGILTAAATAAFLWLIQARFRFGCSLILHMAAGWWAGFLLLVVALGWRMTPPRGDNWAGCLGMAAGLLIFCHRHRMPALSYSGLLGGAIGGIGFALANAFKLLGIKTGWQTNWHSVLEQSYGLINGLGVATVLFMLSRRTPPLAPGSQRSWTTFFSAGFLLVAVTYLNLVKSVGTWIKAGAVPEHLYSLNALTWFRLAYGALAILIVALLIRHWKSPLPLIPSTPIGRGQLLFLIFLWWMVMGNFERALVSFTPQRLITEGVIFLNAILCTALVCFPKSFSAHIEPGSLRPLHAAFSLAAAFLICTTLCWGMTRWVWGDTFAGHRGLHIRFGPDATATKAKPSSDKPHP